MEQVTSTAEVTTVAQKSEKFVDANELDKKLPPDLLMKYQGKWYILKAGLELKAFRLYGGGGYSVQVELVERTPDYVLAKATFVSKGGAVFTNFGEASKLNVTNPMMQRQLLHLAVTRAECRVLRMATACGFVSLDEMDLGGEKDVVADPSDSLPPTPEQLGVIEQLYKGKEYKEPIDQAEAKKLISEAGKK